MTAKTFFRLLIVLGFVWTFVFVGVGVLTIPTLPQPLLEYVLQHTPDRPLFIPQSVGKGPLIVLLLLMLIVSIAMTVGLWRFRRWARLLLIVIPAFTLISQIFAPPFVLPSVQMFCLSLGQFIADAAIVMAFLPPVAHLFSTRKGLANRSSQPLPGE